MICDNKDIDTPIVICYSSQSKGNPNELVPLDMKPVLDTFQTFPGAA